MKKLILLVAMAVGGYLFVQNGFSFDTGNRSVVIGTSTGAYSATEDSDLDNMFECDGREHCSQMTSRAEAEYFNRYCPNTKMDGDGDGIPCENDSRW
jgi:hypothetical protein